MACVYKITNIKNNKMYIGISIDYQKRWKQHVSHLNKNKHCNWKLQKDWNKYGPECFMFDVLEECSISDVYEKEIEYITLHDTFNNGYNLTIGGDKGGSEQTSKPVYVYSLDGEYLMSFCSRAEAERSLKCHSIKECCLGVCKRGYSKTDQKWYQYSYQYFDNLQPYIRMSGNSKEVLMLDKNGKIIQTFISIADANRFCGNVPSSHCIRDAAQSRKPFHGTYWCFACDYTSDWEPFNENTIVCFDLEGNLIGYYRNATHAGSILGIDNSSISKNLKGKRKTCDGKIFRFIK